MTEVRGQKSEVSKGTALSTLLFALSFLSASLLALCLPAEAQRAKNVSRIGFIGASSSSTGGHYLEAFRQGLRDLGVCPSNRNFFVDVVKKLCLL